MQHAGFARATVAALAGLALAAPVPALATENPPVNPFAPTSVWPAGFGNAATQQSIAGRGPEVADSLKVEKAFVGWGEMPSGLVVSSEYSPGVQSFWGINGRWAYKFKRTATAIKKTGDFAHTTDLINGYGALDRENRFFVQSFNKIFALGDATPGDPDSGVAVLDSYTFPADQVEGTWADYLFGLGLMHDGALAVTSKTGMVARIPVNYGSSNRNDVFRESEIRLTRANPTQDENVANSIATEPNGSGGQAIYVNTDTSVNRFDWNPATQTISKTWGVTPPGYNASGTTPDLVGHGSDPDRLVAVSVDGPPASTVVLWRDEIPAGWTGPDGVRGTSDDRVAGSAVIDFAGLVSPGNPTENSNVSRGYQIANARFEKLFNADWDSLDPGIQAFRWNPATRTLQSAWVNTTTRCPNGMLAAAEGSDMGYCAGRHNGQWTFEMFRWSTGQFLRRVNIDSRWSFNPAGNGMQISNGREALFSSWNYVVRVRP
jgi:hypothetical protein